MTIIHSHISTRSDEFQTNVAYHRALAAELRERIDQSARGGSEEARGAPK